MADTSAPGDSTRRISWGNRLLAPAALIVVVIAIVAIVSANTGGDSKAERDATAQVDAENSGGSDGPENPKTYTVEEGDTLGAIAEKFSVSTDRLERLNPEIDPQTLNAGQELQIR